MQRELTAQKEIFTAKSGVKHGFNTHLKMNELFIKKLLNTSQLSPKKKDYIFDYDNQFIPTEKYDSKRSYKQKNGYFPGDSIY